MNRYFNFNRFTRLLKYDVAINKKKYILFALGMFVVLFFVCYYLLDDKYRILVEDKDRYTFTMQHTDYITYFILLYFVFSIIVIGNSFSFLRTPVETSTYLMLSASSFEKFMYEFLIRIVFFNLLYFLFFWLSFKLAGLVFVQNYSVGFINIPNFGILDSINFVKPINKLDTTVSLLAMFSFTTFMFAGASYFRKYALFKTILAFGMLLLWMYVVTLLIYHVLLPNKVDIFNMTIIDRHIDGYSTSQIAMYIIGTFSSLFLLPLTYFKLKEKEV